jgi:hypothetical protein
MPKIIYEATLWRGLAEEARNAASRMKNRELRLQVLLVAARYLVLARRAEAHGKLAPSGEKERHHDQSN